LLRNVVERRLFGSEWAAILVFRACASLNACSRARTPSSSVVQAPSGLVALFIQLPGSTTLEVMDTAGPYVGHIKDAIIAKFKRFRDLDPSDLLLFKLGDAGSRTPLNPTQTLSEAGIGAGTKLGVELTAATQASLTGM
jgi:hypothetical protein